METSRRNVLSAGLTAGLVTGAGVAGSGGASAAPAHAVDRRPSAAAPGLTRDPFTLGVASGDPAPDGFVLWTRLAPSPLADDGLGGMPSARYDVRWEVAADPRFRRVERRGIVRVGPETAHAAHVELRGLRPGREYHYRFSLGRWTSAAGLTRTSPRGDSGARLTMAFASCSNYPVGYFTGYRAMAEERPDLILHLGDYQYEGPAGVSAVGRSHVGPETVSLANYRQRYAQYKTDPDLQAAHAIAPWLAVWDDHEVDNNYAGGVPENAVDAPTFRERRAAAYRAYYENMPLRRTSVPRGPDLQLYRRVRWGGLATFHMLDTRQYRSDQACGDGFKDCPDAADPTRSLPGMEQETWLAQGFRDSVARWDVIGQQVFFGQRDNDAGAATTVSMDAWDGYPASRERVVRSWVDAGVRNPVVLTGDVHAHWASEVLADPLDGGSAVLGSELIATSITSGGDGYDDPTGQHPWAPWNPNLKFWTNLRGYVSTTFTRREMTTDFRCVPAVTVPDAEVFTRRSYVIEDRVRGLQLTADNPLPTASTLARGAAQDVARTAPSDAQIIEDTLRTEGAIR